MSSSTPEEFDYVIVGGGVAGCVLANRLSEDGRTTVLLLEAGISDKSRLIHTPAAVAKVWNNPKFNWSFYSEPEPYANNRVLFHPRGKVLGGSSSINMMSYVRGHRSDYDRWESLGAKGWSFDDILPYFRRSENFEWSNAYRGKGGPLQVSISASPDEVYDAFLAAGKELGYPVQDDYNGPSQDGFAWMQLMTRRGRRSSAAAAYLRPALRRTNLTVRVCSHVEKVLLWGGEARGVAYRHRSAAASVTARREVILSAGAFGSPQILMLSGLGPSAHLREHDIKVEHDLPGVGSNLRDHPQVNLTFSRRGRSRVTRELRLDRLAMGLAVNEMFGVGFASEAPGGVTAFVRSNPEEAIPDLELFCIPASLESRPWLPPFTKPVDERIIIKPALLRPESVGHVRLANSDPGAPPRILTNFLKEEIDRRALREGIRICRNLARTSAFSGLIDRELSPSVDVQTDAEIDAFVRQTVETIFHPCGTCRMGQDDLSVVDPHLRVHGLKKLRVVDASVMPDHIGSTINTAVVAIAERASDLIRNR